MNTPKKRFLIIEQQSIVSIDIRKQLEQKGFGVTVSRTPEELIRALEEKAHEIIMVSPGILWKYHFPGYAGQWDIPYQPDHISPYHSTSTIIIRKEEKGLVHFPKPYNTKEVIDYITAC